MPDDRPAALRVFISYSHDSAEHVERVLGLADRLRHDGIDAWIDQYEPHQDHWPRWMVDEITRAELVLAVCTATYRRRFEGHETDGGQGADWEGAILTDELYARRRGKVIPILFGGDAEQVPTVLRGPTRYDLGEAGGYERLYRRLTDQPVVEAPQLGRLKALPAQVRRSTFGLVSVTTSTPEPVETEATVTYRTWAQEHYGHLDLIGLGAGEMRVGLDEIYVPLRIGTTHVHDAGGGSIDHRVLEYLHGAAYQAGHETLELDRLFLIGGDHRHALIFGEPGSGKTTALRKLHQLAFDPGPEALGLPPGTLPIFLRLRRWTPDLLDDETRTLADFLDVELQEVSGGRVPAGLGAELWQRGRLLLLLDGLDEIADEAHRARVLQRLSWCLGAGDAADVSAVVSTRPAGWTDTVQEVQLSAFLHTDVRPFDDAQIGCLIDLWFREVVTQGELAETTAADRVAKLKRALVESRNQQLQVLVATPMLLTLLCIVVVRGGEIPRRRVDFYEECLKVLLGRWRQHQTERRAPVEPEQALALAGDLAWTLHSRHTRDDLTFVQAARVLSERLGDRAKAFALFHWLHREAGVLDRYTEKHYGFSHLGLQEHLTARHLAAHPDRLDDLEAGWWADSWWEEVALLLAALPDGRGFVPLMRHLLGTAALHRRADLLTGCLSDVSTPDWSPFVDVLRSGDARAQIGVLRILRAAVASGHEVFGSELLGQLRVLSTDGTPKVRSAAQSVLGELDGEHQTSQTDVFVLSGPTDEALASELVRQLRQRSLRVAVPEAGRSWEDSRSIEQLAGSSSVLVAVGEATLDVDVLGDALFFCEPSSRLAVLLPGRPRPRSPMESLPTFDLPSFDPSLLDLLADRLQPVPVEAPELPLRSLVLGSLVATPSIESSGLGESFREPITEEMFLWVPGGRFEMGDNFQGAAMPIHWVRVSPFWLARTPVTNRQYGKFLEACGSRDEPLYWRDRKFSDASQPVVGVTWHDAMAYCDWLTSNSQAGRVFQLPSEAQWEFAARGEDGRLFPWGDESPSPDYACFIGSSSKPAHVGSYVGGAGPYGHLDLAGNVLEWCLDLWELDYMRWADAEPLDPIGEEDPSRRPLRGGSWAHTAQFLQSAKRGRFEPRFRDGLVGFRVLCSVTN